MKNFGIISLTKACWLNFILSSEFSTNIQIELKCQNKMLFHSCFGVYFFQVFGVPLNTLTFAREIPNILGLIFGFFSKNVSTIGQKFWNWKEEASLLFPIPKVFPKACNIISFTFYWLSLVFVQLGFLGMS